MKSLFTSCLFVLFTSTGLCDDVVFYPRSSTFEEGVQRGNADMARGYGKFLEGLGNYELLHQEAESWRNSNYMQWLENRQRAQDLYRERHHSYNYLDSFERKLDNAERYHKLKQRELDLIDKGVLPPKKYPSIVIRGREYNNVYEWRKTVDYKLNELENYEKRLLDEIDDLRAERKYNESIAYRKWWESKPWYSQQKYLQRKSWVNTTEQSLMSPRFEFKDIEIKLSAHFDALARVRHEIEKLKEYIKTKGNVLLK